MLPRNELSVGAGRFSAAGGEKLGFQFRKGRDSRASNVERLVRTRAVEKCVCKYARVTARARVNASAVLLE